jgi:tRNA pseudouridine13 synthase
LTRGFITEFNELLIFKCYCIFASGGLRGQSPIIYLKIIYVLIFFELIPKHIIDKFNNDMSLTSGRGSLMLDKYKKILGDAPEGKSFVTREGEIKSLKELRHKLAIEGIDFYNQYVSDSDNHFAKWIHDVFMDETLADSLKKTNSLGETIELLDERIHYLELWLKFNHQKEKFHSFLAETYNNSTGNLEFQPSHHKFEKELNTQEVLKHVPRPIASTPVDIDLPEDEPPEDIGENEESVQPEHHDLHVPKYAEKQDDHEMLKNLQQMFPEIKNIDSKPKKNMLGFLNVFGKYTYFELKKRDYNTEEAVRRISQYLTIPRKRFSYAGAKDRAAVTTQYCSLLGKLRQVKLKDIDVKVVCCGERPISLGDLLGNEFSLVVRNITKKPDETEFIVNYYDDQRFGRHNLEIGLSILHNDYKKACSFIENENVLEYLKKNPTDFIGALRTQPLKTLKMYIHSVQSWLWNEAVIEYIKSKTKKYDETNYSQGTFVSTKNRIENIDLPLISFDTEYPLDVEEIYQQILKKIKLTVRDFIIRKIPEITPAGSNRSLIAEVDNLVIGDLEDDELNKGMKKIKINFRLQKGSYATIVIKRMFAG